MIGRMMPMAPPLTLCVVDVRDVAEAHIQALVKPEAEGRRILCCADHATSLLELSGMVRSMYGQYGYNPPTRQAPYFLMWILSQFDADIGLLLPQMNVSTRYDVAPLRTVLGVELRPLDATVRDGCDSLVLHGVVPKLGDVPVQWAPPS